MVTYLGIGLMVIVMIRVIYLFMTPVKMHSYQPNQAYNNELNDPMLSNHENYNYQEVQYDSNVYQGRHNSDHNEAH